MQEMVEKWTLFVCILVKNYGKEKTILCIVKKMFLQNLM
jgi:hypothetical protein